jgi:DNA-directed RNA polymerase sigma subunit (sigma70/sigma32)
VLASDAEIALPEVAVAHSLRRDLDAALATLDERACGVLRLRYGLIDGCPHTLEEGSVKIFTL